MVYVEIIVVTVFGLAPDSSRTGLLYDQRH